MLKRRLSLFLPLLSSRAASGHFAVVLSSLSLRSVHPSCSPFICLQGQSPLDAFILRSLVQFLLCSVHLSLVAVFCPIKIQSSVVRLHYTRRSCTATSFNMTNTNELDITRHALSFRIAK